MIARPVTSASGALAAGAVPRLRVKGLRIILDGTELDVVDEVSFELGAGDMLGLVGESGSGKTTVALALLAYTRRGLVIAGGSVEIDGQELIGLDQDRLQAVRGGVVAYVPQDAGSALNPALRIGTQLNEMLSLHAAVTDDRTARVREVLAEASLDSSSGMLRRYPHQLSGGQLQRVAIAMAFACRPRLIVLDEPTTGLDVSTQRRVLDTLRTLCKHYGVAAICVSHDLAAVGELVDQIAVLYAGRVVELGTKSDIFGEPRHPYTRSLIAAIPSPLRGELLQGIEGQPPSPRRRPTGCYFAPRCPLRIDACDTAQPPLRAVGERLVRCIRAEEAPTLLPKLSRATGADHTRIETAVLEVRGLSAGYGETRVLHDVNLRAVRQQCVAIVGESGSGKTTLARCIVGLHRDWSGDIAFEGHALPQAAQQRARQTLRRIQYVFQNPYTSLNPRKTVGQILVAPLEHFRLAQETPVSDRVHQVLEDVSLGPDFLARYPGQLSGGERQRVAIARALIVDPEVLVCDEITSALDVSVQAVVIELLRRLQRERDLTLIFITHNLALVRSIAQECLVLADGLTVESGAVEDVLERPRQPYTQRLVEDIPRLLESR